MREDERICLEMKAILIEGRYKRGETIVQFCDASFFWKSILIFANFLNKVLSYCDFEFFLAQPYSVQ